MSVNTRQIVFSNHKTHKLKINNKNHIKSSIMGIRKSFQLGIIALQINLIGYNTATEQS